MLLTLVIVASAIYIGGGTYLSLSRGGRRSTRRRHGWE